ncbi:MAG: hypothetical protein GWN58_37335, partial [Anaerolineae bacterium]|nr:hypothetical protein [Anaerolineae bacterium]
GAYRTADGELVFDGKPGSIAGGDDVARRIRALEQAAEKAGEAGYDNAVQIMREVTEYTGTAEV